MLGLRWTRAGERAEPHQRAWGWGGAVSGWAAGSVQGRVVGLGHQEQTAGQGLLGHTPGAPGQVRQERGSGLEFAGKGWGSRSLQPMLRRVATSLLRPRALPCLLSLSRASSGAAPWKAPSAAQWVVGTQALQKKSRWGV